jgi:hydroxymethylbilane synthase
MKTIRLGTRGSELALWQTGHIGDLLQQAWPGLKVEIEVFSTKGDQILDTPLPLIGGKGLFTAELEAALRKGAIDAAVHSLKDLPTELPAGLMIGAVPERVNPADVLVSREAHTLESLPLGATVGTSSRRRAAQLLQVRADLKIVDIRGNVPTRIRKALDPGGPYDAVVLAYAGLARLDRLDEVSQILPLEIMLPAPGQGALGVQCRNEALSLKMLAPLDHPSTRHTVTAERSFLSGLGGGCAVPIAAYASLSENGLTLQGRIAALDGSHKIDIQATALTADAQKLGRRLAQEALTQGAGALLQEIV